MVIMTPVERSLALAKAAARYLPKAPCKIKFTEIGVFNGDNACVVISNLQSLRYKVCYYGFDLFEQALDIDISISNHWLSNKIKENPNFIEHMTIDNVTKRLVRTGCNYKLVRGDTRKNLDEYRDKIKDSDLFYIDGGHSYPIVKSDWEHVRNMAKPGCVIVFDDTNMDGVARLMRELRDNGIKPKMNFDARSLFVWK